MKPHYLVLIVSILFSSCIPVSFAPNIKNQKVMKGKRFKRSFPKTETFIFHDHKKANEIYKYMNIKFERNGVDIDRNVPFEHNGKQYTISFYEAERSTQTLNLAPVAIDVALERNGMSPMLEDAYTSRKGKWYVGMIVKDENGKNCLKDNHPDRAEIFKFLVDLREEYLTTFEYEELLLKKKP
ncbi:hypothetical protein Q2T40_11020 [Winogradskyella maritima]|uniref:Lipoprotein n=1 Tax=Winogradskyella maritima TaxID=1517766 RepID=A0ABV8AJN7_9FLAO|nr:hypothetical protein [Winogradskyella maritima]